MSYKKINEWICVKKKEATWLLHRVFEIFLKNFKNSIDSKNLNCVYFACR